MAPRVTRRVNHFDSRSAEIEDVAAAEAPRLGTRLEVEALDDRLAPRREHRLGIAVELHERVERLDARQVGFVEVPRHVPVQEAARDVVLVAVTVEHAVGARALGRLARDQAQGRVDHHALVLPAHDE